MVNELKENYKPIQTQNTIIGITLCIISVVPIFLTMLLKEEAYYLLAVSLLLILVSFGVNLFVKSSIINDSFRTILQIEDLSPKEKKIQKKKTLINTTYWLIATAIYLAYSLPTGKWNSSWIIWMIAVILFPILDGICTTLLDKN